MQLQDAVTVECILRVKAIVAMIQGAFLPFFNVCPSMIIASHSTWQSLFNNDPQPALKCSSFSKKRTAASTASTAEPPFF